MTGGDIFQNIRTPHDKEEEFKDMTLESSKRGFHKSSGVTSTVIKGNERTRLVRCVHCGFICDKERESRQPEESWAFLGINQGSPLTASNSPLSDARDSVTGALKPDTYYDRVVLGGCACCGSFLYDKMPQDIGQVQ